MVSPKSLIILKTRGLLTGELDKETISRKGDNGNKKEKKRHEEKDVYKREQVTRDLRYLMCV